MVRTPGETQRTASAAVAALAAAALWGGMYVVSKDTFDAIPPITLGAIRLAIAAPALLLVLARRGGLSRPRDAVLVLGGIALAGTMIVQFVGTDLSTASQGALLTTTTPLFIVPLAWAFLRERPGWMTAGAMALGMGGVALAVGSSNGAAGSAWGTVLLLVSALGWAAYTIASAPVSRREGPLVAVTWATLYALPIVAALSLFEADRWRAEPFTEPGTLLAIAYLGLGASAGAWYLWNRGVAGLPAAVAGAFFFAQPIVGGLLATAFLGERLTLRFAAGGALILAGVVLALRATRPPVELDPKPIALSGERREEP